MVSGPSCSEGWCLSSKVPDAEWLGQSAWPRWPVAADRGQHVASVAADGGQRVASVAADGGQRVASVAADRGQRVASVAADGGQRVASVLSFARQPTRGRGGEQARGGYFVHAPRNS